MKTVITVLDSLYIQHTWPLKSVSLGIFYTQFPKPKSLVCCFPYFPSSLFRLVRFALEPMALLENRTCLTDRFHVWRAVKRRGDIYTSPSRNDCLRAPCGATVGIPARWGTGDRRRTSGCVFSPPSVSSSTVGPRTLLPGTEELNTTYPIRRLCLWNKSSQSLRPYPFLFRLPFALPSHTHTSRKQ